MNVLALICARGGSKGVPGKNMRSLAGRPLIVWSIDACRAVSRITRVVVSTDSEEIASIARSAGAEVPFLRPAALATDDASEWLVWRHALESLGPPGSPMPDVLISVSPTAPLRAPVDLERCLDEFGNGACDAVITVTPARRNPYYNMVTAGSDGVVQLVNRPERTMTRRQDVPPVYDMTTVCYVVRPGFVLRASGLFDGVVRQVLIPAERALDIDTPLDFQIAECLMGRREPW